MIISLLCNGRYSGTYGLKNKRECWRVGLTLSTIRSAARQLLTLPEKDPKRLFEGINCFVAQHSAYHDILTFHSVNW
jgi:hypothetical protein